jgi:hypothetical protein
MEDSPGRGGRSVGPFRTSLSARLSYSYEVLPEIIPFGGMRPEALQLASLF